LAKVQFLMICESKLKSAMFRSGIAGFRNVALQALNHAQGLFCGRQQRKPGISYGRLVCQPGRLPREWTAAPLRQMFPGAGHRKRGARNVR